MAKTNTNPFTQTIKSPSIILQNADGAVGTNDYGTNPSNTKLVFTAGSDGSILKSLTANNNDSAKTLQVFLSRDSGTTKFLLFTVALAANAGWTTVVTLDVLTASTVAGLPIDQSGRPVLPMEAGEQLYVGVTAAVTASKTIYVNAVVEDF
jgi:hypothetical protein